MRTHVLLRALLATLLGVALLVAVPQPAHGQAHSSAEQADEWSLWCWVNRERISRGLHPLPMGTLLRDDVARPWSRTLASRGTLSHRSDLWAATTRAVAGTDHAGENVGYSWSGYSVRNLYDAWMRSSGHRANILSSRWEYIGIGVRHTSSNRWGVQNFASTNRTDVTVVYPSGQQFIDVCSTSPFFGNINWMARAGVSTGTVHPRYRLYRPTTNVSRSALSAFIYRAVTPGTSTAPPTCSTSPHPFPDASRNQFAAEICWMYEQGINDGPGSFHPDQAAARARMADWLFRAAGRHCGPGQTPPQDCYQPPRTPTFSDVGPNHPQHAAIEWAAAAGITTGYPDGTFQPNRLITREAIAAMLHRYVVNVL